ncbi:MAG: DUF2793 domain-containing protein [Sphingopyxis sp.]|uniref:DUF2793 domain-containing protein n=1 Tax=Sphingopyxis sp. TaxID=1908224 RepID=UPI002ABACB94|nr:DUF2793 domain-containing protein [Sphingopyxis sp.]MDZ3830331.1 DUF2793 domain-containing protein [Sphingopyxis sp.]
MSEPMTTPRFALPLLAVAQAQKEVTHNEALSMIDALVQTVVEAGPLDAPPAAPAAGQCWIVGGAPTGAWSGQAAALAIWTAGGWRFVVPRIGMRAVRASDGAIQRFGGGGWNAPGSVADPVGGATIDSEARVAIAAIISQLATHGLLIPA